MTSKFDSRPDLKVFLNFRLAHHAFPTSRQPKEKLWRRVLELEKRLHHQLKATMDSFELCSIDQTNLPQYLRNIYEGVGANRRNTRTRLLLIITVSGLFAIEAQQLPFNSAADYVDIILNTTASFINSELAPWILDHGGWNGMAEEAFDDLLPVHICFSPVIVGLFVFCLTGYVMYSLFKT